MNILIDNFDFWDGFQTMRYWSHPKTYDLKKKKEESKNMVLSGEYYGSRKMDGIWQMIIKDNDGIFHARSRTESVNGGFADKAEWIPAICEELKDIPNGTVLLGELYFPDNEGSRKVTSVFNCLKSKCLERQEKNGNLHFYIFDVLAYSGKSLINTPFEKRIEYLNKKLDILSSCSYVERAVYKTGTELWTLFNDVIASGGEGIVITKKTCKYLCGKRTARATLKLKKELEDTIDAFYDGNYKVATRDYQGKDPQTWGYWYNEKTGERTTSNKYFEFCNGEAWIPITKAYFYNWPSAISFSVMKDGKPVHLGYIAGITEDVRAGVVENPELWIGKVAEINAMEIETINGTKSLRHGRIMNWRDDKKAEDCLYEQIE